VILESDPYRRLAFTFHTFVPELSVVGLAQDIIDRAAAEPRSTVTMDIEPVDDNRVKLTVVHTGFPPESIVRELVSGGWPSKLSDLKSHLELQTAVVGAN
jgi:Activator of Hsp90 ATPase homolog 1-like protein